MEETRQEKFKRLATKRTNAALESLRLLGNLSNRANYDYTDEEVRKIFKAIDKQLRTTKLRFSTKKSKKFQL